MAHELSTHSRRLTAITFPDLQLGKTLYRPGPFPPHQHANARLVFVIAGRFTERFDGRHRECRSGTVLFRPPAELHSEVYGPAVTSISVDLAPRWVEQLRNYDVALPGPASVQTERGAGLAVRLDAEMTMNDSVSRLGIEAILFEAAVAAARARTAAEDRRSPPWLRRAVDLLQAEQARSLTLLEVSRAAGVHPAHLARVFRRVYGCSVGAYVRRARIERARDLLTASSAPLSEIALTAGFADQSHFCRTFKACVGVSPGRYRLTSRARSVHPISR